MSLSNDRLIASAKNRDKIIDAIYHYISVYTAEHTYPPNQREIAQAVYLSRSSVIRYLRHMETGGLITLQPKLARGITLVKPREYIIYTWTTVPAGKS